MTTFRYLVRARLPSLIAFGATVVMLVLTLTASPLQSERLEQTTPFVMSQLIGFYSAMSILLGVVVIFEPHIRQELQQTRATNVICIVGAAVMMWTLAQITPVQATRFFLSSWLRGLAIIYLAVISGCALWMSLPNPLAPPGRRTVAYSTVAVMALVFSSVALYILSRGHYLQIDLPDEAWSGSIATSYARNGQLHQTFAAYTADTLNSRYYMLMGLWARWVGDMSLLSLRTFPLLTGSVALAAVLGAVAQSPWTNIQRFIAIVLLLVSSTFLRTTHHLRMDIIMAVHGALLLLALVMTFREQRHKQYIWLFAAGFALYPGLEGTVWPPLILNTFAGLALIIDGWLYERHNLRRASMRVIVYGAGCIAALLLYTLVHFAPDFYANYQNATGTAQAYTARINMNLAGIFRYYMNFSLALSPVEIVLYPALLVLALVVGTRLERLLAAVTIFAAWVVMQIGIASYGYMVLFAPLAAYVAASALKNQFAVLGVTFIVLPGLFAPVLYDTTHAITQRENMRHIAELELIEWRIAEDSRVLVDEGMFWFALNDRATIIHEMALSISDAALANPNASPTERLQLLEVDSVICRKDERLCRLTQEIFETDPIDFIVTDAHYLYYTR